MEVVRTLLRFFSLLFHGLLALFLLAVSGLAMASGAPNLHLEMLPWTGATLLYVVFFGALAGIAIIVLAILSKLRPLFFVWALLVFILMFKGYLFSGYRFAPGEFRTALYLLIAAVVALPGAWFQMRRPAARSKRY